MEGAHVTARPGLADAVVRQLLTAVEDGRYPVGARLPAEAVLAGEAGVSRLTLREAVRVLRDKGVLRVEQGRGTFVNPTDRWAALDVELLSTRIMVEGDLVRTARLVTEVRSLIEVGAAELAAARRGPGHLVTLGSTVERMKATVDDEDVGAFSEADLAFHETVLDAAANPLLTALMQPIRAMMVRVRAQTSITLDMRVTAVEAHTAICAAVVAGDQTAARRAMAEHMAETHRVIDRLAARGQWSAGEARADPRTLGTEATMKTVPDHAGATPPRPDPLKI